MAVIRCSGDIALSILESLSQKSAITPRHMYQGLLKHPETGHVIDDACFVFFKGPHSFTGEDCVEFHAHSSLPVIKALIRTCTELGARHASKGEFTKRAYINGKIDLSKAEGISDIIHAKTELETRVALNQLEGKLYKLIQTIKNSTLRLLEQIEGSIDFPEEVDPPTNNELKNSFENGIDLLKPIIDNQSYGKYVQSGVKCLIIGYPNVGKSSVLNQLLGEDRAIVSSIKGTTRDFIESSIEIGGLRFELIDTAGYRETNDPIETLGIEKIQELLPKTDVVLWVIDQSRPLNESEKKLHSLIPEHIPTYLLLNKEDVVETPTTFDEFKHNIRISISAKNGSNIEQIKDLLYKNFSEKANTMSDSLICNIRQLSCIQSLYKNLQELNSSADTIKTLDMLVIDLKQAILLCGDITGESLTEHVLDGVFSRFCVGK